MRIKSLNNTNFKGIYLVMGANPERESFKKMCDKYPKKLAYMPVGRDKIECIKDYNEPFYKWAKNVAIGTMRQKASILVTGDDFKKYKKREEGFKNADELVQHIEGIINLPIGPSIRELEESEVKDLAYKHPEKYVSRIF